MKISLYIQELLFTRQQVSLPGIGTFELIAKPAQIDNETGTIAPPSKIIKFKYGEDIGYSVLATHIGKKENISPANAIKEVSSYSERILDSLRSGQEFEIGGVGVLKMLGTGTIIFLPISSYSSLGDSLGLPTLNLDVRGDIVEVGHVQEANDTPQAATPVPEESSKKESKEEEEDAFELIEDPIEADFAEKETHPEKELPDEHVKVIAFSETNDTTLSEVKEQEELTKKSTTEVITEKSIEPTVTYPAEPYADNNEVPVEKSRFGWIWMFLVIICILSISTIALYHYNPSLFDFIKWNNSSEKVEPKVPSEVDTTYYKAITGTLKDTAAKDSSNVESARENLQKIDSAEKTKQPAIKVHPSKDRPMSKEEMENLINEKLKLGNVVSKSADTQQKSESNRQVIDGRNTAAKSEGKQQTAKQPLQNQQKQNTQPANNKLGGYNVIAASVRTQNEAQKEVAKLKAHGYNPIIIEDGKGKIRISVGSYPDSRSATNAARAVKAKTGVDAWILNP